MKFSQLIITQNTGLFNSNIYKHFSCNQSFHSHKMQKKFQVKLSFTVSPCVKSLHIQFEHEKNINSNTMFWFVSDEATLLFTFGLRTGPLTMHLHLSPLHFDPPLAGYRIDGHLDFLAYPLSIQQDVCEVVMGQHVPVCDLYQLLECRGYAG